MNSNVPSENTGLQNRWLALDPTLAREIRRGMSITFVRSNVSDGELELFQYDRVTFSDQGLL